MNYFELFEIPVQLSVDRSSLQSKFIELSKKYHPDYFVQEDDAKQLEMLELSAMLNKAWKTFQHSDETIKYVLQQKELLQEEEKYSLPPDFLMEVLEINERLMDGADRQELKPVLDRLQTEIYEPVKQIVEHYSEGAVSEEELLQVKEYYFKKKYLDRLRRELAGNR